MNKNDTKRRVVLLTLLGITLMAAGFIAAISVGAKEITWEIIWQSIVQYDETNLDMMLIRDSRMPRVVASLFVGGFLAISGCSMQGITRNPIADPTVLGMSQGATFAVAFSTVVLKLAGASTMLAAMIGAVLSGAFVLLISVRNAATMNVSRLLLAGTAASTFLLSLATTVALLGNRSQELAFWIAGGFSNTSWDAVYLLVFVGGICTLGLLMLSGKINLLSIGEEMAIGLGIHPTRLRILSVLLMIPICAVCVSVSGNIVFVGLIIPHIIRFLIGSDYRKIMPLSFLYGAVLLVWADIAAKAVNAPYETPIGLFTSLLGVPFFLILVRKERG